MLTDRGTMLTDYEIRAHQFFETRIFALAKAGKEDFLEKLERKPKSHERLRLILGTVEKVSARGLSACIGAGNFVRLLDGSLGLAEVKVSGKVIRVMCYCQTGKEELLVLLFDFDGHKGKSGAIAPDIMDKGRKLARIAGELAGKE